MRVTELNLDILKGLSLILSMPIKGISYEDVTKESISASLDILIEEAQSLSEKEIFNFYTCMKPTKMYIFDFFHKKELKSRLLFYRNNSFNNLVVLDITHEIAKMISFSSRETCEDWILNLLLKRLGNVSAEIESKTIMFNQAECFQLISAMKLNNANNFMGVLNTKQIDEEVKMRVTENLFNKNFFVSLREYDHECNEIGSLMVFGCEKALWNIELKGENRVNTLSINSMSTSGLSESIAQIIFGL